MLKKKSDWRVLCVGLVCLTILEMFAIEHGINGTVFTLVIAIIGGVLGFTIKLPIQLREMKGGSKNG